MRRFLPAILSFALLLPVGAQAVTLDDAIAAAEHDSVQLRLLREQTAGSRTLPSQAWSLLSPKLIVGGSYTLNERAIVLDFSESVPPEFQSLFEGTEPTVVQQKDYFQANLTVQQTLFSGDALPTLMGSYRIVDAAEYDEARARGQIKLGIVQAYYGVLTAREAEQLSIDAQTTAKAQLALAQRQVDAETAPPRAALQAELSLSQATRDVAKAHEQRIVAEDALSKLTGLSADVPVELPKPPQPPAELETALATARTQRPDILAAEQRTIAARLQSRANVAGFAPDVTGRFTWAYTENTGFNTDKTPWMVVIEGQWVLWDGGYRVAKGKEYATQAHSAALAVDQARLTAETEVRAAWEAWHRAQSAVEAVEHEQTLAAKNLDLAKRGFEAGTATWYEVEQAELGDRAAKLQGLIERMNRDVAAYQLLVATGAW